MPGLLEEFYSEDLGEYYYVDDYYGGYYGDYYGGGGLYYMDYYVEDGGGLYYEDELLYYDDSSYYQDEWLYYNDDIYYADELLYYQEEEPQMFFKKEVNIAPQVINTPRDAQGNSWDAASFEIDQEIESIAYEEDVDYATAYRILGQRYETFEPDLSDYV